ncbi:MAG TPA: MarR family transcriptional regulator [Aldersonia sp.]
MEAQRSRDVDDIAASVRTLVWSLRRFGERESGLEPLPHSEYEVVRTVGDRPGTIVSDVARALSMQSSNVSTAVRRLVERGLLTRQCDPNDRRSTRLWLTPLAEKHRRQINGVWQRGVDGCLADMTPDEVATLEAAAPLLRRLATMADDAQ